MRNNPGGGTASDFYQSTPPASIVMTSPFSAHFVNNEPSSTATSGDYETSMIRTSQPGPTPISSLYQDEHYSSPPASSSSSSLPATLQGALQGALMSQQESGRRGMHQQANM